MSHLLPHGFKHKILKLQLALARNLIYALKETSLAAITCILGGATDNLHDLCRVSNGCRLSVARWTLLSISTTSKSFAWSWRLLHSISAAALYLAGKEAFDPMSSPAIHSEDRPGGGLLLGQGGNSKRTPRSPLFLITPQSVSTEFQSSQRAL